MKTTIIKKISAVGLAACFSFGCSAIDSTRRDSSSAGRENAPQTNEAMPSPEKAVTSLCANRFYPVKDGLKHIYHNSVGSSDTVLTMEYQAGAAEFVEVTTLKDVNVRHVWRCTADGLIAANFGSGATMSDMKLEPKHISGATLPRDEDLQIGKTWQTVYEASGTSELGSVATTVTISNRVAALDESVKTPAGDFKALKIEMDIASEMRLGGRKIPVPVVKSAAWYAPDVGMIKASGNFGGIANTMEYVGDK